MLTYLLTNPHYNQPIPSHWQRSHFETVLWHVLQQTTTTKIVYPTIFHDVRYRSGFCWSQEWWRWWVVTTGAISRAKLQSNRHHQQTNTQLPTGRMPFLSPNQQCQSTERKNYHTPYGLAHPKLTWVFQPHLWPLKAPVYLEGGLRRLSSAVRHQHRIIKLNAVWLLAEKIKEWHFWFHREHTGTNRQSVRLQASWRPSACMSASSPSSVRSPSALSWYSSVHAPCAGQRQHAAH